MEKTIYDLKLNETMDINSQERIRRVPGGWIYSEIYIGMGITTVFVPFSNEFMNVSENVHNTVVLDGIE